MKIAYCEKWLLDREQPLNILSEEVARQRHEARNPYVALLSAEEEPRMVVDVAGKWVSVDFLDNRLRKWLSYNFCELEAGRLFLKNACHWEFIDDSDKPDSSKIFRFDVNGTMLSSEVMASTNEQRVFESAVSLVPNWEHYPNFGEYSSLCQIERRGLGAIEKSTPNK